MEIQTLSYFFATHSGYPSVRYIHPTNSSIWNTFKNIETNQQRLAAIEEINWILSQDQTIKKNIRKALNRAGQHGIFYFKENEQMILFLEEMKNNLETKMIEMLFFCSKEINEKSIIEYIRHYYGVSIASLDYPDAIASGFLICNEHTGNFPLGCSLSFPIKWDTKIEVTDFCSFLASQENCMILLDNTHEKETYSLASPSRRIQEVMVEIEGESFNTIPYK